MVEPDWRRVLDAFADAVIAADSARRIVYINAAAERLLGWPAHQLVGQPLITIVPPRFHALHTAGIDRYLATRQPKLIGHPVHVTALRRDGSEVEVELTLSIVLVDKDELFVASLRDLRERIALERQIAITSCLQATNRVATAVATLTDPDEILRTAVDALVNDFSAMLAQAWFYDQTSKLLSLRWRAGQLAAGDIPHHPLGEPASYPFEVGEVIRTKQPLIVADVQRDTRFKQTWITGHDITALAAFPLVYEHEVRGVLVYCARQPLYDEIAQALLSLSSIVAACLTNAHLLANAQTVRMEAEASQKRFHDLVQGLDAIVWEADAHTGRHTFISKRAEDILGYPTGRWLEEPNFWMRPVHPEDWERVMAWYNAAAQSTEEQDIEYRAVTADGCVVWLHDTVAVIRDASGVPKQLRGLTVDVTERKRTQDSLRESEERFRTMADSAPVLLWISETDGKCIYFNQPWLDFTGRRLEQELGDGWAEGVHPDDRQRCLDIYWSAFAERRRFSIEYRLRRADGMYRWVLDNGIPHHMPDGSFAGYIGSCIDITERKQAEEALKQSEEQYRLLFDEDLTGDFVATPQGELLLCNPAFAHMFGFETVEDALEAKDFSLFPDPQEHAQQLALLRRDRRLKLQERELMRPDGEKVIVAQNLVGQFNAAGDLVRLQGYLMDITKRKRAEQRLALQYTISRILAESANLDAAAARISAAIGEALEWAIGAFWSVDRQANVLHCRHIWHVPTLSCDEFAASTLQTRFAPNVGLPGRVWFDEEPIWVPNVDEEVQLFPRFKHVAKAGIRGAFGFPIRGASGVLGVIEFFSQTIRHPDEALMRMMAAIGNMIGQFTERKLAEEELHATYQALQAVISASPLAIMAVGLDETINIWNPAAERIFGWSEAEVLGRRLSSLFDASGDVWRTVRRQVWQQGGLAGLEVQFSKKDGSPVDIGISTAPLRDPNGAMIGLVAVIADVSERKQAEERQRFLGEASTLLAASLDYETTLAHVAQLAVPVLADWCIIDMVEGDGSIRSMAMAHVEAHKQELLRNLRQRYPLDITPHHPVLQVLRSGRSQFIPKVTEEMLATIAQNAEHLASIHELSMKSAMFVPLVVRGRVLGAITFASARPDRRYRLSDLLLAEELARRAAISVENARLYSQAQQAILARDEFLSIASHELKTPLTSLKLQLQSLLRSVRKANSVRVDPERLAGKLQNTDEQAQRMAELVEQLLDVTRIRAGRIGLQLRAADLVDIVRETVARFEEQLEQAGCAVNVYADGAIVDRWDGGRIDQIVSNLLSNAIKYGPGRPIEISVSADDANAVIAVRDFGIGIAPEDLERIFVRFERAVSAQHYGGLGLGLYIVRQTVDALGGSIRVQSTPGVETTFTVELPRNRGARFK